MGGGLAVPLAMVLICFSRLRYIHQYINKQKQKDMESNFEGCSASNKLMAQLGFMLVGLYAINLYHGSPSIAA